MKLGPNQSRWPINVWAHRDSGVKAIVRLLLDGGDQLLDYATLAARFEHAAKVLAFKRSTFDALQRARAEEIDAITAQWRAEGLALEDFNARRGAVVEQLVKALLRGRPTPADRVHVERKVVLSDGHVTRAWDVLSAADPPWEGYECKVGPNLGSTQGAEISDDARRASLNGDELLVVVASAADRRSLLPELRSVIANGRHVRFADRHTFFSIGERAPNERVAS